MNFCETFGAIPFKNENEVIILVEDESEINQSIVTEPMVQAEVTELFKDFQTKIDIYSPFNLDEIMEGGSGTRPTSPTMLSTGLTDGQTSLETEIVVIGSFLDKLPNLAGLARTCEIFSVKTLYVPDLSALSSPDFLNVAMTAEKWLDIRQLAIKDINQFLETIKREGKIR
jgi:tRNA G18 (ribose-2'-O)-methylase SpoU